MSALVGNTKSRGHALSPASENIVATGADQRVDVVAADPKVPTVVADHHVIPNEPPKAVTTATHIVVRFSTVNPITPACQRVADAAVRLGTLRNGSLRHIARATTNKEGRYVAHVPAGRILITVAASDGFVGAPDHGGGDLWKARFTDLM